jgi:DNA-directed RNA polymerase specialized sigma subunit
MENTLPEIQTQNYLYLAESIAHRIHHFYSSQGVKADLDDVISASYLGLCKAADSYNITKGSPWLKYAERSCTWACHHFYHYSLSHVHIPWRARKSGITITVTNSGFFIDDYEDESDE